MAMSSTRAFSVNPTGLQGRFEDWDKIGRGFRAIHLGGGGLLRHRVAQIVFGAMALRFGLDGAAHAGVGSQSLIAISDLHEGDANSWGVVGLGLGDAG